MGWITNIFVARKLKRILSEALDLERENLGSEQSEFVTDFIEHGEWGLARQQVVDALDDRDLVPTARTQSLLAAASEIMNGNGR